MDIELIKRMMDACYQGKRIRDMLPPLPDGVASSFIQYLDIIEKLEKQGIRVKISDVSDALSLPRPGVTRTVKDMEAKGYVKKLASAGRPDYLSDCYRSRKSPFREVQQTVLYYSIRLCRQYSRGGHSMYHPDHGEIL